MPSDSNGVYSLPSGYSAVTGEVIQASQHNPPLEDIASSISQRLMRTGAAPMTGPLKASDGSVGSPAITFNTDSTTGLYKTASGFGISVGGVKVAEFTSGGVSRYLGELIPYTRLTAEAFTVLPYGQTLSRTTYADLWEVAQDEIAAGNIFYNNGNGTTTFGIGDMRGRVVAGKDNMGVSAATRLTSVTISPDANTLGATGGTEYAQLARSELPNVTCTVSVSGTVSVTSDQTDVARAQGGFTNVSSDGNPPFGFSAFVTGTGTRQAITSQGFNSMSGSTSSLNGGVTQGQTKRVQPTMICNFLLYVGA